MMGLRNFQGTRRALEQVGSASEVFSAGTSKADKVLGTFRMGGVELTLRKAENVRKPSAAGIPFSKGTEPLWYVTDSIGNVVGGYNGKVILQDGKGLMHAALGVAERAGDSFLPKLMERTSDAANFTEDGARFLRNAIKVRLEGRVARRSIDILNDTRLPTDLALDIAKKNLSAKAFENAKQGMFVIVDVPAKAKHVFAWRKVINVAQGPGRFKAGVRRTVARITPGAPDDSIELFNTRKGMLQMANLLEHYGMEPQKIDDLLRGFPDLDLGARQEWFISEFMHALGRETGVPAFENMLVQFYKSATAKSFAASGADQFIDIAGNAKRVPILSTQMTTKMPIPLDELNQVFRRARSIANRSKRAKGWGFNGRGIGKTNDRRAQLVSQLKVKLGAKAEDFSEEELWDMAYSLVSPGAGMDARGFLAGKMAPPIGSFVNKFHHFFTKSMLVLRPVQWMWRVAMLEEPIRAHIYNMPSLYSNPLAYAAIGREAFYINKLGKWRGQASEWGEGVYRALTQGVKGTDEVIIRLKNNGLFEDIFPKGTKELSLFQVKQRVAGFIQDSVYGRTRIDKLDPIKKVGWAVRNRTWNISKAEGFLTNRKLGLDFDFAKDAEEITMKVVAGYLGESVGATAPSTYRWTGTMTDTEAYTYGQVYGAKLVELVEDVYGKIAMRRLASRLAGETPGPGIDAAAVINSSRWELMRPDLKLRYPGIAGDVELAEKYMDEVLDVEVRHLLAPFLEGKAGDEAAEMIETFVRTSVLETTVADNAVKIDLRGANYAGGTQSLGELATKVKSDLNIKMPESLTAPSFDPRFMAHDDKRWPTKVADWTLATFGESATQLLNRRPAWLAEYSRWFDNYKALGVTDEVAAKMANGHATKMVNYVFFNMDEAPYYAQRLNKVIPFFGATYEVLSAWTYKMPVAVGGTWPVGGLEFARKFDRLMDGLVNMGFVTRNLEEDGSLTHTLNLVPSDSLNASDNEVGRFLAGAGFKAIHTVEETVATILGMEEGLALRSDGYRLAVGHPLNFEDFGMLSFAQTNIGMNPLTNITVTTAAALIPGAAGPKRTVTEEDGETLAELAERLDLEVNDLVRYNRDLFTDTETFGSYLLYNGILAGVVDPTTVKVPGALPLRLPDTSTWENVVKDIFQPFGDVDNIQELGINYLPGTMRWALAGLALQNQPTDSFFDGELSGVFAGLLPSINRAQLASQISEAFMYVESHERVNGMGPFERITQLREEVETLRAAGKTDDANDLLSEVVLDEQEFLKKVQETAAESLLLRSITGQMLPTAPGHVREEARLIQSYWDTKEYADSILIGKGQMPRFQNFKSTEELENYYEQLAAWLSDPTGDAARGRFRENYPQLMAYLTPKTFYTDPIPDVNSYAEYQEQIESGERKTAPLHVTMWKARSSAIQADYYNEFIIKYGNDPVGAAAAALTDRGGWQEMNDDKDRAYQGLEMWDEMYGSVYSEWRQENFPPDDWAQDETVKRLNKIRDNLSLALNLEDTFDFEFDLDRVNNLNNALKTSIAEVSKAIKAYTTFTDRSDFRNPYERAINDYFEQVYIPYQEEVGALYDLLPEVADSEAQSLVYERIKLFKNQVSGSVVYLNDDTTIPFPTPLDYSWAGKTEEEQAIKVQQWVTRPLQWIDQDQALRIIERQPIMAQYLPTSDSDFDLYRQWTLDRLRVDEAFEAGEVKRGDARKLRDRLEEEFRLAMMAEGRGGEIEFLDMTPYDKLELSGELPAILGILAGEIRFTRETLAVNEETPGTINGIHMVAPLYNYVETLFYSDSAFRDAMQTLGINLQDEDTLDNIMPWLFFDYSGER